MRAVYIADFGDVENIGVREISDPTPPHGSELLVRARAAGLNRADLLQRRGLYPPPAGYSPNIPGLEFAGEVVAVGSEVGSFNVGDRVFGITAGEAQAEFLLIDQRLAVKIPNNLSFIEAAAVPEVFITAHDAIFTQGELLSGEWLLIHAVGSGVGLAALQLAKARSARVIGTSRTQEKLDRCREFGIDLPILTTEPKFADNVVEGTGGVGSNVILDLVGGPYFPENLKCVAIKGRIMLVGLTGGGSADIDLRVVLSKRLKIIGTTLRGRSADEKASAVRRFADEVVPYFASGDIKPNVDRVFPVAEVRGAHRYLESNDSFGKVVLEF